MIPSRKLIVRRALYLSAAILGFFIILHGHWDFLQTMHAGNAATHAARKDNDGVAEASTGENAHSPDMGNLPADTPSRFLATTNPDEEGFRNTLTFRTVQKYVGQRHAPSETAYNHGGCESMLTLRIVDQNGTPVPDVPFRVAPMLNWSHLPSLSACTDSNGCATVRHPSANSYTVFVRKEGYYDVYGTIQFFNHHYACVDENRWIPWNPQVELVLRQQLPLVRLSHFKSHELFPVFPSNMNLPFDFLVGDFLPPYGCGKATNAVIRMSGAIDGNRSRLSETIVTFPHGGGMRKEIENGFCQFSFPREISDGQFSQTNTIRREFSLDSGEAIAGGIIPKKEFFALKIPASADGVTNGFVYGVMTKGPIADLVEENSTNATLFFEYYLNTEVGNRIVEAKELIGQ